MNAKIERFGDFLQTVKKGRTAGPQVATPGTGATLLRVLEPVQCLPVAEVLEQSAMDFGEFYTTLNSLESAQFVTLDRRPEGQVVMLTETGRKAAAVMS